MKNMYLKEFLVFYTWDTLVYHNWQTTTLEQNTTTQQINGMHYASKILISVCSAIYNISTMMHHARWQGMAGSW